MLDIRFATTHDATTILRLVRALAEYERLPETVELDVPTLEQQLTSATPPFECLLAEESGRPLGFALFFHTYSTFRGKRGLWLEDLLVLPEHRRRGIGRALLERVVSLARERGCGRLEWSVLDWNQPAIDFYRSFGAELMDEWTTCRLSF